MPDTSLSVLHVSRFLSHNNMKADYYFTAKELEAQISCVIFLRLGSQ